MTPNQKKAIAEIDKSIAAQEKLRDNNDPEKVGYGPEFPKKTWNRYDIYNDALDKLQRLKTARKHLLVAWTLIARE